MPTEQQVWDRHGAPTGFIDKQALCNILAELNIINTSTPSQQVQQAVDAEMYNAGSAEKGRMDRTHFAEWWGKKNPQAPTPTVGVPAQPQQYSTPQQPQQYAPAQQQYAPAQQQQQQYAPAQQQYAPAQQQQQYAPPQQQYAPPQQQYAPPQYQQQQYAQPVMQQQYPQPIMQQPVMYPQPIMQQPIMMAQPVMYPPPMMVQQPMIMMGCGRCYGACNCMGYGGMGVGMGMGAGLLGAIVAEEIIEDIIW